MIASFISLCAGLLTYEAPFSGGSPQPGHRGPNLYASGPTERPLPLLANSAGKAAAAMVTHARGLPRIVKRDAAQSFIGYFTATGQNSCALMTCLLFIL
jgi:hypothetical protein